jgi:deoxyxylulose-5-phosphate synthase
MIVFLRQNESNFSIRRTPHHSQCIAVAVGSASVEKMNEIKEEAGRSLVWF